MTSHRYPTLLVAALAATFIGAATAQTQSGDASRLSANKGMPQADQTQPSQNRPDKMKGEQGMNGQSQNSPMKQEAKNSATTGQSEKSGMKEHQAMSSDHPAMTSEHNNSKARHAASEKSGMQHEAMNSTKTGKHASKSKQHSEEAAAPDEKAYREALRDCVKEQNDSQRDSCLDGAIERFHRNA